MSFLETSAGLSPVPTTFDEAVADLRHHTTGLVLTEDEKGYDEARQAWNRTVDQRPAVIVVAATVGDLAEAVRFARANRVPVAVQATGHGVAEPADGAVLLVTSRLDAVTIDPLRRTATVGAGATWAAVLGPAEEHGLAPLMGSSSGVGAVGYTLGGGMGWLARRYGLASDSVRSFEVVTPDGIECRASDAENPELFWALRGGGAGSLCVVTAMEIELFPVATVYAGNLLYPVDSAREVMRRYREWVSAAPLELTSAVAVMNFPFLHGVPEPLRGRAFALVRGCWSGDPDEGRALVDQWREWRTPVRDLWTPIPFSATDTISMDPVDPVGARQTTEWATELSDPLVDALVDAAVPEPGCRPTVLLAEARHAGGAVRANGAATVSSAARRDEFLIGIVGLAACPDTDAALRTSLKRARRDLAPFVTGATSLNFADGEERRRRTASAFGTDQLARLRAVKTALDPEDRFRHGLAIRPSCAEPELRS